jgi:hypothetical protein
MRLYMIYALRTGWYLLLTCSAFALFVESTRLYAHVREWWVFIRVCYF